MKKKIGSAVQRNYLKRIAREVFRTHKCFLNASYDIVLMYKSNVTYKQVLNDFKNFILYDKD